MPDYKEMYLKMVRASEEAVNILSPDTRPPRCRRWTRGIARIRPGWWSCRCAGGPASCPWRPDDGLQAVLQALHGEVVFDNGLRLVVHDLLDELRDSLIVVIEGVAVDAALQDDVLHSDLGQGPVVQQLQQRRLDDAAGQVRHNRNALYFGDDQ